MKRFTLIIASFAIGLALLVGASTRAFASGNGTGGSGGMPGDGVPCYYNLYTCSYQDSMAYWSGCNPDYGQGLISTANAKAICTAFHSS